MPSGLAALIDDDMRGNAVSFLASLVEEIMSDSVFEMVLEKMFTEADVGTTLVSPRDTEERSSDKL